MMRTIAFVLLLIYVILIGCERMETTENVYQDFDAAYIAEAVGDDKWIPGFLPPSAKNIREKHNLDTNEVWLSCQFSAADRNSIMKACRQISQHEVIYPIKSPSSWWPHALIQSSKDTQSEYIIYEYYHCKNDGIIAIHANEIYYWHSGRNAFGVKEIP